MSFSGPSGGSTFSTITTLADDLDRILAGLPSPSFRRRGRWPDEEWFYLEGFGPTRYAKVVVHYEQGEGRIVTVFPRRAFP